MSSRATELDLKTDTSEARLAKKRRKEPVAPETPSVQRYMEDGANVISRFTCQRTTIFHRLVEKGSVECVQAVLTTAQPIDFTVNAEYEGAPFHLLCHRSNREEVAAILQLIVDRLKKHPEDKVDFNQAGKVSDFISYAARCHRLALFWVPLKKLPFFADYEGPIPINARVHWKDWLELPARERIRFRLNRGIECCPESTTRLQRMCASNHEPNPLFVLQCVDQCADVFAHRPGTDMTLLERFFREGSLACVAACLQTADTISFSRPPSDNAFESPFYHVTNAVEGKDYLEIVCQRKERHEIASVLRFILERVKSHPGDYLCWDGFIETAVRYGVLSYCWSVLTVAPMFTSVLNGSVAIKEPVHWEDWSKIPESDREHLLLSKGLVCCPESTAKLQEICVAAGDPDPNSVLECVSQFADITAPCPGTDLTIFHHLLREGSISCVLQCLQTASTIDFSPFLEALCQRDHFEEAVTLLTHIVDRLHAHPADSVRWEAFADTVARFDSLSRWWPHLRDIPYFKNVDGCIPINVRVNWEDWVRLAPEDRKLFRLDGGLRCSPESTAKLQRLCMDHLKPDPVAVLACVEQCADVFALAPGTDMTILECFLREGSIGCVAACLQTADTIDLTQKAAGSQLEAWFNHCSSTIDCKNFLEVVCQRGDPNEVAAILKLIIDRCNANPSDKIRWEGFVETAARYGVLSYCWPLLPDVACYQRHRGLLPVGGMVWKDDLEGLKASGQYNHFELYCLHICVATPATAALWRHLAGVFPDPSQVRQYAVNGADISTRYPCCKTTLLHVLIEKGTVDCIASALQSSQPIDFSVQLPDVGKGSPLHLLCIHRNADDATAILALIMNRLKTHPEDRIDFKERLLKSYDAPSGLDFLSLAAHYNKLALFWPLIKHHSTFDNSPFLQLMGNVSQRDWNALGSEQVCFVEPAELL